MVGARRSARTCPTPELDRSRLPDRTTTSGPGPIRQRHLRRAGPDWNSRFDVLAEAGRLRDAVTLHPSGTCTWPDATNGSRFRTDRCGRRLEAGTASFRVGPGPFAPRLSDSRMPRHAFQLIRRRRRGVDNRSSRSARFCHKYAEAVPPSGRPETKVHRRVLSTNNPMPVSRNCNKIRAENLEENVAPQPEIHLTVTGFGGNMTLGSKRFEEQRAERKRSEPGTLIRSRNYSNRAGGGERRAIGRIREVSLSIGGRVERFDPEGSKRAPKGSGDPGADRDCGAGVKKRVCGGDLARTGANRRERRSRKPNGLGESSATHRSGRPGTSIPERRSGNGQSLRGSERPLRDAGSSRSDAGDLQGVNPSFPKRAAGSRGVIAGHSGCKALSRACRRRVWLSFGSLGTNFVFPDSSYGRGSDPSRGWFLSRQRLKLKRSRRGLKSTKL